MVTLYKTDRSLRQGHESQPVSGCSWLPVGAEVPAQELGNDARGSASPRSCPILERHHRRRARLSENPPKQKGQDFPTAAWKATSPHPGDGRRPAQTRPRRRRERLIAALEGGMNNLTWAVTGSPMARITGWAPATSN